MVVPVELCEACGSGSDVLDDVHDDAGARIHEHDVRSDPDPDVTFGQGYQLDLELIGQAFPLKSGRKLATALDLLLQSRGERGPLGQAGGEVPTTVIVLDECTVAIAEHDLDPCIFALNNNPA